MDIHTGDEIEDVHHMLQSVTHDSCQATAKITQALKNIQERDEMLTEALARAQEASAAKTAFLSSMSHEIRTPIEENAEFTVIRFTMEDTGIGMEKAFLPRLYDPFVQEDATTTNRYGGSGLGMAITKNMIALTHRAFLSSR